MKFLLPMEFDHDLSNTVLAVCAGLRGRVFDAGPLYLMQAPSTLKKNRLSSNRGSARWPNRRA